MATFTWAGKGVSIGRHLFKSDNRCARCGFHRRWWHSITGTHKGACPRTGWGDPDNWAEPSLKGPQDGDDVQFFVGQSGSFPTSGMDLDHSDIALNKLSIIPEYRPPCNEEKR